MRTKILLAILSCVIMPIFFILVLGVLQGVWFDVETVIERPEYAETHTYQDWQYCIFYIALVIMSLFEFSIIYFYLKNMVRSLKSDFGKLIFAFMIAGIAIIVWCGLATFFIVITPYVKPFDWY